jgi:hypothetical protein
MRVAVCPLSWALFEDKLGELSNLSAASDRTDWSDMAVQRPATQTKVYVLVPGMRGT